MYEQALQPLPDGGRNKRTFAGLAISLADLSCSVPSLSYRQTIFFQLAMGLFGHTAYGEGWALIFPRALFSHFDHVVF